MKLRARRLASGRIAVALAAVAVALAFAVPGSAMPTATQSFLGMGHTSTASIITGDPPDPNGAVGLNEYVEAVNGGIEVFNKDGSVKHAAISVNSLWAGYVGTNAGNGCATNNDGDPIVRYDRLADRWLITQFSLPNENTDAGPSFQCVAVSKTGDPTGAYWLYDFKYAIAVNDYAKIGVWPDAYYATFNFFNTTSYKGVDVCAWDRAAMLNGDPATQQCSLLPYPSEPACPATQSFVPYSILPANADGSLPPPSGSPEYLMQFDYSQCSGPYNKLDLWKFHVDWTTPAHSSLTGPTVITVPNFTPACYSAGAPNCIPQQGSTTKIDGLDDRLMDRLVYRNYGTYESLFANHTVSAGAGAGIRWYEIRSPGTTPTLHQSGTYAPADTNWRWMGSIAADQAGDVGLGYSVSDSSGGVAHPSIAWTGRLATDPLGTMGGQGETILHTGAANAPADETLRARWGDYTSMTVDPSDDCTFWYVNEVEPTGAAFQWDTYVQSFKFPTCAANDFTITPAGTVGALQGSSGNTIINTAHTTGTAETLQLTAFDLPAGTTASFQPSTVTAGGSSKLTLTAGAATPAGTYTVEVAGTAPSAVHGTPVTFTVTSGHTLTVLKSAAGAGKVKSSPDGIDCGNVCSASFADGTPVTLTEMPDTGSKFLSWSGDCSGQTCSLTMSADHTATANFDGIPACTNGTGVTSLNTAIQLALSCSDPDSGDTLAYSVVSGPTHGMLGAIDSSGHVSYMPFPGYTGPDSFTFKATDSHGTDSPTATVNLTVQAVAAPTCTNHSVSTPHNTAVAISLPCSAPGAITYSVVSAPSHGSLGSVSATGGVTYTPTVGFAGNDTFTFKATDTHAQTSNTATVTVTVGPDRAPLCSDQTISVRHNTAKRIVLGCTDADPGNTVHWAIISPPGHGTLSAIDSTGALTYKPRPGFGGLDRFTFKAIDNESAGSNLGTVNLHVAKLPCAGLTGKRLKACKAKRALNAALKRCARIKNKTKRTACIKAARRRYRRALSATTSQVFAWSKAPRSRRPDPLLVYLVPRCLPAGRAQPTPASRNARFSRSISRAITSRWISCVPS
jgi:Bacterial Ig domain/Divergent InlB B-repeat domain